MIVFWRTRCTYITAFSALFISICVLDHRKNASIPLMCFCCQGTVGNDSFALTVHVERHAENVCESWSRWWQLKSFVSFHPEPWGKMIQFDLRIFLRWAGSTTHFAS